MVQFTTSAEKFIQSVGKLPVYMSCPINFEFNRQTYAVQIDFLLEIEFMQEPWLGVSHCTSVVPLV